MVEKESKSSNKDSIANRKFVWAEQNIDMHEDHEITFQFMNSNHLLISVISQFIHSYYTTLIEPLQPENLYDHNQ
uniref:Uncharacterized protein n=1 Tax=Bracon brevicornis TaxID=1563983 RepID=A0A6V7IKN5_9HYME